MLRDMARSRYRAGKRPTARRSRGRDDRRRSGTGTARLARCGREALATCARDRSGASWCRCGRRGPRAQKPRKDPVTPTAGRAQPWKTSPLSPTLSARSSRPSSGAVSASSVMPEPNQAPWYPEEPRVVRAGHRPFARRAGSLPGPWRARPTGGAEVIAAASACFRIASLPQRPGGGGRICLRTFLLKVCVQLPWLASYSMISRIRRALVASLQDALA